MIICMRVQGKRQKSLMRNWRSAWIILTLFQLQGENGTDLKFLENLVDDNGINSMAEGDNMPMDEEYGDMLVDEHPDGYKEAMDKYLNM